MKTVRGFTLLELMVVVAIVAVLAALAISSYSKQVRKSRRAEAKQVLSDYSLREEKFRSNNTAYTITAATLLAGGSAPATVYYTVTLAVPAGNCNDAGPTVAAVANSYQITATAIGDQTKDTGCTPLVFASKCGEIVKTPVACW